MLRSPVHSAITLAAGVLSLSLSVSSMSAQPTSFPSDSAVRAILQQRVDAKLAAGYAVGFIDGSGATRVVTVGAGPNGRAIDAHTIFEIGSITKTFTAVALASMVADGTVKLDQPVAELLPAGTVVPSFNGRAITLADLATQSSGLPRLPGNLAPKDPSNPYVDYDGARLLAFLRTYQLTRAPGAAYDYSNLGTGLLGYALAARAGMSYDALITQRVLRPLGMNESAVTLSPALRAKLAPGHDESGEAVSPWDFDALAGAGALRSSITDMLRYLAANVAASSDPADPRTGGIGATLASAHAVRFDKGPSGMKLGLAWHRITRAAGDTIIWHNGATGGFASFLGFSTRRKMGVVILSNTAAGPDGIAMHFLLGTPLPPAVPTGNAARTAITIPPATLDRYTGRFEIAPNFALVIARRGDGLTVTATGQAPLAIFAESPSRFFLREVEADLVFEFDTAGQATAVTLEQNGTKQRGVRK